MTTLTKQISPFYRIYEPVEILRRKYSDNSIYYRIDRALEDIRASRYQDYLNYINKDRDDKISDVNVTLITEHSNLPTVTVLKDLLYDEVCYTSHNEHLIREIN